MTVFPSLEEAERYGWHWYADTLNPKRETTGYLVRQQKTDGQFAFALVDLTLNHSKESVELT